MLVLIPEKVPDSAFLGHVLSEYFHRSLQIRIRKSLGSFLHIRIRRLQGLLQLLRIGNRRRPAAGGFAGQRSGEQPVLRHDQIEYVAYRSHAFTWLPVVLTRHDASKSAEFIGKCPGFVGERRLNGLRLQCRKTQRRNRRRVSHGSHSNCSHRKMLSSRFNHWLRKTAPRYSWRSATSGSIRLAFRAGMKLANNATPAKSIVSAP